MVQSDIATEPYGQVPTDYTIRAGSMVKLFLISTLVMSIVLLFLLVDIAAVYTGFIEWVQDQGAWGPIIAALAWIPVCMLFIPGLILSLSCGFAFDFLPAVRAPPGAAQRPQRPSAFSIADPFLWRFCTDAQGT